MIIDFSYYLLKVKNVPYKTKKANDQTKKIAKLFFLVFLLIFIYKSFLDIKVVRKVGYSASLSNLRINYPVWTKGAGTFFYIYFYMLLMHKLSIKETKIIILLYVFASLLSGLRGARAAFFVPTIFALYYLVINKIIKMNITKLIILIGVGALGVIVITIFRGENLDRIKSIRDIFYYVFYNQTQTFNVSMFYLDNKAEICNIRAVPYIFSDLLHKWIPTHIDGSMTVGKYARLPEGFSLGNSLFLELLDMPIYISVFVCISIGYFIKFIQHNFLRNRYLLPLFCTCVMTIFYMPRDILFAFLEPLVFVYMFCSFFFMLILQDLTKYTFLSFRRKMHG